MKRRVVVCVLGLSVVFSGMAADFSGEHYVEIQRKYYAETGTTTYETFVKLWPGDGLELTNATFITPYGYEDSRKLYALGGNPSHSQDCISYEFSNFTDLSQTIVPGHYTVLVDYTSAASETFGFDVPSYSEGDFPSGYVYPTNILHGDTDVPLRPTFQMGSQDWSWMEGYEDEYYTFSFADYSGVSEVTVDPCDGSYLEPETLHLTVFDQNDTHGDVFIGSAYEFRFTTGDGSSGNEGDADGDGLPDWWEEQYFSGATNANPSATCSNGVNTLRQAYIAGLNPTNPTSLFLTSVLRSPPSVLRWNAVSGRVYSVWWTSNLLSGFQSLESNIPWTGNTFTDTTYNAEEKGFYKIDVELEE